MSVALCLTRTVRFAGNGGGKDSVRSVRPPGLLKAKPQLLYGGFVFVSISVHACEHASVCVQVSLCICLHVYPKDSVYKSVSTTVACIQYTVYST